MRIMTGAPVPPGADSVIQVNPDSSVTVPEDQVHPAPTGGNTLVQGNLELRLPSPVLRQRLRWAVFVDGGTVWERGGPLSSTSAIRFTPGFGLRFATPLGPTRFDLAYNPYRLPAGALYAVQANGDLRLVNQSYERPSGRRGGLTFQFSVGQAF